MAIKDLDQVKEKLYELFNEAVDRHSIYADPQQAGGSHAYSTINSQQRPENFKIQNRIAIGTIGQAIADIEQEQRISTERKRNPLSGKDKKASV